MGLHEENEVKYLGEDSDIVAVCKPVGLPTTYRNDLDNSDCAVNCVTTKHPELLKVKGYNSREGGLVYRLDNATSGLLLFACRQGVFNELSKAQSEGRLLKRYFAVCRVSGKFKQGGFASCMSGDKSIYALNEETRVQENNLSQKTVLTENAALLTSLQLQKYVSYPKEFSKRFGFDKEIDIEWDPIDLKDREKYKAIVYPIGRSRKTVTRMIAILKPNYKCKGKPKETTTHLRVIAESVLDDCKVALVEAVINKGVRHQIRVHLAAVGLPVYGDQLYKSGGNITLSQVDRRMYLHCVDVRLDL